jgi:hypothetical protein
MITAWPVVSGALEYRKPPWQAVVVADDAIGRNRSDERERHPAEYSAGAIVCAHSPHGRCHNCCRL